MKKDFYTIEEIASLVDGDLFLSTDVKLKGIGSLADAEVGDISFLGNERYINEFKATKASLVLAPSLLKEAPAGVGVIHVENPTAAFSKIINLFEEAAVAEVYGVSPSAVISENVDFDATKVFIGANVVIEEGVTIGNGTVIKPGTVVARGSSIGENCLIYPNVTIREKSQIGNNVILQPGCVIGSDGFGYEQADGKHVKIPQIGIVVIEDEVEIGANSTIDRARFGKTVIGAGTKIDNLVQIAHNVNLGEHNIIVAQSGIAGSTSTGKYFIAGAQSGVSGHLKIGDQVTVAAQSGLAKSLNSKGAIVQGTPARPIKEVRKSKAYVNRLPKLFERIKAIEEKLKSL